MTAQEIPFGAGPCDILLQPKQAELYELLIATGAHVPRRIGWGGARGAAKSGGLRRIAVQLAENYPNIVIVIVRKHLGDLIENHVEKMALEYPIWHKAYYSLGKKEWQVKRTGSRIILAYGDTTQDILEFSRGPEYTFLFVDQAEQFTEQELTMLTIPNRWPAAEKGFAKSCFFFNPGGPGTEFLRRVFHQRKFKNNEAPEDWYFIQAYGWDNFEWFRNELPISFAEFYSLPSDTRFEMFINQTSEGDKMNKLPASIRVGELLGSFEHFSGQYYAGVWDENTCILSLADANRLIQPWWPRWMATDWGFAHHAPTLWFTAGKLSPEQAATIGIQSGWPVDVVIVYREFVISDRGEEDLARDIVQRTPDAERRMIRTHWLSPDAWAKRGSANTVADQMGRVLKQGGLAEPSPADNDRIGGWRMLYNGFQRCNWRSGAPTPQEAVQNGPALLISAACPEVASAVPLLIRDEDNIEDVLKTETVGDDVADALRYGFKSYLNSKSQAPRDVRAQETYQRYAAISPTAAHMAMLQFNERERSRGAAKRAPSWRNAG